MVRFIDDHRAVYGVEPICRVLEIAPSSYYAARQAENDRADLARREEAQELAGRCSGRTLLR